MKRIISLMLALVLLCSCLPAVVYAASENIALNKPTFASSIYNDSYLARYVNDGSTSIKSMWASGPVVLTGPKGGYEYVAIDLEREYIITRMVAHSRLDMERAVDRTGWLLQVSNDPEFSEGVVTVGTKVEPGEFGSGLDVKVDLDTGYRYVRLASMNSAVVSELEVYGEVYIKPERIINSYPDIKGTALDGKVQLLQYLEILTLGNAKTFDGQTVLTRAESCELILRLANMEAISAPRQIFEDIPETHPYAGVIAACYELGMISDAQHFNPDQLIKPIDFLKMLEVVMGYKERIWQRGGYPEGIRAIARDIDLYTSDAEYVNREIAAEMLYSALLAPCMVTITNGVTDTSTYGDSMLMTYYGMDLYRGRVNKNSVTGLSQANYSRFVEISGKQYNDAWGSLDGLLGRDIYYIVSKDEPTKLLYYWEDVNGNEILTLKCSEIQGLSDGSLKYYMGDRTASVGVSAELNVILNGVAYNGWTAADFKNVEGEVTLIDCDEDGMFETAIIERPQIIVVRAASSGENKLSIKSKNNQDLSLQNFEKLSVYKNGRTTTLDSAEENNLIMAYVSADSKVIRLEIITNMVSGVVDGSSNDGMKLGGIEYLYSEYYKNNASQTSYIGKNCTFILNDNNEIIFIEKATGIESESRQLGFIAAVDLGDTFDVPRFKIFVKDGVTKQEWYQLDSSRKYYIDVVASGMKIYDCATKVSIDGVSKTHSEIRSIINSTPRQLLYRMAFIKTNKAGELVSIVLDSTASDAELKKMDITLDSSKDVLMFSMAGLYRYNQMVMPIDVDNSQVFTIPTLNGVPVAGGEYDDLYNVSTARSIYGQYTIITSNPTFYQPDEFGYPAFSVRYRDVSAIRSSMVSPINTDGATSVLVKEVIQSTDESGDVYYEISGINLSTGADETVLLAPEAERMYDGYKILTEKPSLLNSNGYVQTLSGSDLNTYSMSVNDLKPGDLIRYTTAGSRDGTRAAQLERVYAYGTTPLASYVARNGAFRSVSNGGANYPVSRFRMIYGAPGIYNSDKLTVNVLSDQANKEIINMAKVPRYYICDGDTITPVNRYNFTDTFDEKTRLLTVSSNYEYVAIIAYQY